MPDVSRHRIQTQMIDPASVFRDPLENSGLMGRDGRLRFEEVLRGSSPASEVGRIAGASRGERHLDLKALQQQIGSPLYDFNDPIVRAAAAEAGSKHTELEPKDTLSQGQINANVEAFRRKHPDARLVVIYAGAATHGLGAAANLKDKGFSTILAAPVPFGSKVLDNELHLGEQPDYKKLIAQEMIETNRVIVGQLGHRSYQDLHAEAAKGVKPGDDAFVMLTETGYHGGTATVDEEQGASKRVTSEIANAVIAASESGEKVAVLVLSEDGHANYARQDFDSDAAASSNPIIRSLAPLKKAEVPVSFAGVGQRDSSNDGTF